MIGPPPYPRTPHLWPPAGSTGRLVVPREDVPEWLSEPVVVEEKLDGANVSLWLDPATGRVEVASRGGAGAQDRAGQLGRLRAWVADRQEALTGLLADGWVLYGEWLWLEHGIRYDRLPDWLIALDLWHADRGFAPLDKRDIRCREAGLARPPRLFQGAVRDEGRLRQLLAGSALSSDRPAEGLVLRRADGRRCKLVAAGHVRRSDAEWAQARRHNALRAEVSSTKER
jgi:hypothetical protein